jgi:hypothetical protein
MCVRVTLFGLTAAVLLLVPGSGIPGVPVRVPARQEVPALTAERAKSALVALLRSKPDAFGWVRLTSDELALQPIEKEAETTYSCGCVTIDLKERHYSANQGSLCHAFANGHFELTDGRWVAKPPDQVAIACRKLP